MTAPDVEYRRYLDEGTFALQVCPRCATQVFPPRVLCPGCGNTGLEWRVVEGGGTVASTTTVRRRPDRGGDYDVSLVDLDGGARMLSRVDGVPADQVRIGSRVVPRIVQVREAPAVGFVVEEEQR
ncbi:Zn-ribbon domain-containing OB-fold protein [Pseudonocardia sp. RS010]|uniref:Zn-ribbon domain-containing OB-fold protein n=1 Tax=Pseudonocardia sp. RS010 TaxID=3385979 RepID=UPI0039A30A06